MREMKDSGVEWIGKIPKDWEIVPLTKQLDSIVDYRGKTPEKTEEGTFLVTAKNIKDGKICYELSKEYVREADYEEISIEEYHKLAIYYLLQRLHWGKWLM